MRKALAVGLLLISSILCDRHSVLATDTPQALEVRTDSPVEFILMDPQRRRSGFDPRSNRLFSEIPTAHYLREVSCDRMGVSSCHPPFVTLDMANPMPGTYTLRVIGTGSGDFRVAVTLKDEEGNWFSHVFEGTTAPRLSSRFIFQSGAIFFAAFAPKVKISVASNAVEVNGTFALGPGGTLSLETQPVSIQVGDSLVTIPARSFHETPQGLFVFQGMIRGLTTCAATAPNDGTKCLLLRTEPDKYFDVNLKPIDNGYAFTIVGTGLTDLPSVNPIEVRLAVGNNGGHAEVTADFSP